MSSEPSINVSTNSFSVNPFTTAITIDIIKNHKADSMKYQLPSGAPVNHPVKPLKNVTPKDSQGINPIIIIKKVNANNNKVTFCFPLNLTFVAACSTY